MEIVETEGLVKSLGKLPQNIQRIYFLQKDRFLINSSDSRLHLKKLIDLNKVFSIRVTRRYRVLFYFQNSQRAVFFEIDHRKDVYRK